MPRTRHCGWTLAARRVASRWAPVLAVLFCLVTFPSEAQAYPWLIRHGYTNCSACHADPSGGELLTMYGQAMSSEVLSTHWGGEGSGAAALQRRIAATAHAASAKNAEPEAEEEEGSEDVSADAEDVTDETSEEGSEDSSEQGTAEADASEEVAQDPFAGMGPLTGPLLGFGPVTESFLIGGSFRLASIYALDAEADAFRWFPMQLDLYSQVRFGSFRVGASVGAVKVPAGSPHGRPAQITANQGDGYNLISRTHWVGYDFGEGAHTIRAGRLNLPFGIRMSEHVMWVRERTQTDRESDQQHGVSLYMGFESLRFELMAILGSYQINPDSFRERGYSGYVEFAATDRVMVGLSSLYTIAKDDRTEPAGLETTRHAHGPFVRAALSESVALLAEADVLLRSRRETGYVGFLQLDVEPFKGFHLIGTGEIVDAGYSDRSKAAKVDRSPGVGKPLPGGWLSLQWFFLPHFDMRIDAIIRQEKQILSQIHLYL